MIDEPEDYDVSAASPDAEPEEPQQQESGQRVFESAPGGADASTTSAGEYRVAPVDKRLIAGLIDFVIGMLLAVLPFIGSILAAAYWVVRDGLEVEFMNHRSIGKAIMKLQPVHMDGSHTNIEDSIRRNWMFAPGALIPFLVYSVIGLVLVPPVALAVIILAIVEVYLILTDTDARRLGDRLADTIVIEVDF